MLGPHPAQTGSRQLLLQKNDSPSLRPHSVLCADLPVLRILQGVARSIANGAFLPSAAGRVAPTNHRSTHLRSEPDWPHTCCGRASSSFDDLFRRRNTDSTDDKATRILAQRFPRSAGLVGIDRVDN